MRIITHDDGRCLTLRLLGELDHAAAQEVMPGIEDAVEEYLPRRCVLDLSGLSFMDSSGCTARSRRTCLAAAARRRRSACGTSTVCRSATCSRSGEGLTFRSPTSARRSNTSEITERGNNMEDKIIAYKGMDSNMQCRGMQYEVGKEFSVDGKIECCGNGLHACERPLDVLGYYPPGTGARYFRVEQSGDMARERGGDSKVASRKIRVVAEIGIPGLAKAHIEYAKAHTTSEYTDPERATAGDSGAATAGDYGAATAGDSGAATSRGSASVGANGIACARGNNVRVKGGLGAILVIAEEQPTDYNIAHWKAVEVDGETVKADTWYRLVDGKLVEAGDAE